MLSSSATASDGDLDPTFSGNGLELAGGAGSLSSIATQSDHQVIGATRASLARFTADGGVDSAFGARAAESLSFLRAGEEIIDLDVASDDRIVILTGPDEQPEPEASSTYALTRLVPDGAVDTTFGAAGHAYVGGSSTAAFALDESGGAVLVSGQDVTRLDPAGQLDPSFSSDGRIELAAELVAAAIRPDGSVMALGTERLLQLTPEGRLDPFFGQEGIAKFVASPRYGCCAAELALAPDGSSYVEHGYCTFFGCSGGLFTVSRDGVVDLSEPYAFGNRDGPVTNTIAFDGDGRLLVVDSFESSSLRVTRLLPGMLLDSSFGGNGVIAVHPGGCDTSGPKSVTTDHANRVLVGMAACGKPAVARLNTERQPNLDADSRTDVRDRCDSFPSPRHKGCPVVPRSFHLYDMEHRSFRGELEQDSPERSGKPRIPPPPLYSPPCTRRVPVRLYRRVSGRDQLVRSRETGAGGVVQFSGLSPSGRYYVVAPARLEAEGYCARALAEVELK